MPICSVPTLLLLKPPALKQTKEKSLFSKNEKLVGELRSLAPPGSPADAPGCLKALDQLREVLPDASGEAAITKHLEYWAQLTQLAERVDKLSSLGVKFAWYDAWLPPSALGPSPATSSDITLESAAVLFNAATLAMHHGEVCYRSATAENYKAASQAFLRAAGLFAAAYELVRSMPDRVSVDLREPCLGMLKMLALGHAQRCMYDSAVAQDKKNLLAKFAAAVADYYQEAYQAVRDKNAEMGQLLNRSNNYGKWTAVLMVDHLYYRALSHQHEAANLVSNRKEHLASELLRLQYAKEMLQSAMAKAKQCAAVAQKPNVQAALTKVELMLADATKDNDTVYMSLGPSIRDLETLRLKGEPRPVMGHDWALPKMESLGDPQSNLATYGGPADAPTLFKWIVPSEFRYTAEKVRLQRSEQIQMMLCDIRTETDKANDVLCRISPQLHAQRGHIGSSGAGLSASLRAQIQEAQQNMGAEGLGSSLKEKFAAAEEQITEHMRQLNETKELLNAQIDIDKRIVAQFVGDEAAASWGKVGSNTQYQELCKTEQELRSALQKARNGDAVTKQRLFDADADLKLLSKPLEEIESEVAASGEGLGGQGGRVVELLDSMDALVFSVRAVLKECVSVRDELERLQSDQGVAEYLYRKVHQERQAREEAIRDFFDLLQPLKNKVLSIKERLEQQLQQLQGSSGEMRGIQEISDEIKRREEAIAKYTKALESHARVFAAIREGWMFYSSMGDPIKKILARAQGFAAARELAANDVTEHIKRRQEERLRDLQKQEEEKILEEDRVRKEQLRAAQLMEEDKLLKEQAEDQRQREEARRAQEEAEMELALNLANTGAQSVVRRSHERHRQRSLQRKDLLALDRTRQMTRPLQEPWRGGMSRSGLCCRCRCRILGATRKLLERSLNITKSTSPHQSSAKSAQGVGCSAPLQLLHQILLHHPLLLREGRALEEMGMVAGHMK